MFRRARRAETDSTPLRLRGRSRVAMVASAGRGHCQAERTVRGREGPQRGARQYVKVRQAPSEDTTKPTHRAARLAKNKAPAGRPVGPCQSRPDGQEVIRPLSADRRDLSLEAS